MAAVSHLHLTHGLSSLTSKNPTLSLAIRDIQHSQDPAHLQPGWLPLIIAILEQMLGLLGSDLPETHDRLMVKAALTLGFFGFLRVSEFTTKGRGTFDPKIHPTRRDITGSKDGPLFSLISHRRTKLVGASPYRWAAPDELHVRSLPCRPTSSIARGPNRWLYFTFSLGILCHPEHCSPFCKTCYIV